ncbi:MAG: hypothetical protein IKU29_06235 [Parabacteroides sp.]|nr:hypothetical protein [Parabacteroides sp.]
MEKFALIILGMFIGGVIGILVHSAVLHEYPTAIDVYRNKTDLKISIINEIPVDTVVVFKK